MAGSGYRSRDILSADHDEVRRRCELLLPVGQVDVIETLAHPIHLVSARSEELGNRA
jgi:hypothetical protein